MEDRLTPVLYLEMTDATPDEYARSRVGDVLTLPGVERATWWRNVYRGRPEQWFVLPEFDTLGVYECDPSFVSPSTPAGITGHHFVRTPRPGQGRLTGNPTVSLSLVLISPTSEDEAQALRDWGDFVHLNHIVEAGVPGYTMITPYENATKGDPRFMHFYEFDDPDAETTFKRMRPLVEARLGPWGTPACNEWAMHPALQIMYVNSFSLVGEKTP
ncbi:MAG TPA: hypothetical protein VEP49_21125 [Acidimicrobiia bacterium]|nr:hypothetical protein [Acidimicrobiia bacterium]